jgi:hypothetical protein
LLLSALVIEKFIPLPGADRNTVKTETEILEATADHILDAKERSTAKVAAGVIPILIASFISGLGTFAR